MVSPNCTASVDLCFMRVAQLTATGVPKAGSFGYKTTAIETAKIGTTDDTIAEKIRRNGCGTIVLSIPAVTSIKGSAVSFDVTQWDRRLISLLVGGDVLTSSSQAGAYRAAAATDGQAAPCCIEFWSKAYDQSTQAVTALSTPNASYHHWVLPFVTCSLSTQFTLANGDTVFTITGTGAENPNITADGPWNDWPAYIAGHGGFNTALGEYDDGTIPTAACGLATVPTTS